MVRYLLCVSLVAGAWAAYAQTPSEHIRLERLLQDVVEAGRIEAEAAYADPSLSADDRRDVQAQYARLLVTSRDCAAAGHFIGAHPEIMAYGIELSVIRARDDGDRVCATRLARIMYDRWDDYHFVPAGRSGLRFLAAAYLDGGGEPDGLAGRKAADQILRQSEEARFRWEPRFDAISAYQGTAKFQDYLEYLADRLADPNDRPPDSTRRGIYAIFALHARCDLVARASAPAFNDCAKAEQDAKIYTDPPPSIVKSTEHKGNLFGDEITTDEAGLQRATAKSTPGFRMGMLSLLARRVRDALREP
jgi:hypothetical protein